ncbi:IS1249 family transposase, partial [Isoptericola sp. BMS4]|uniref:IS1249 family transposase n=1 Tax=Isoptericola sp. BMS4 TaxID=2527875 RepID=UPI001423EF40
MTGTGNTGRCGVCASRLVKNGRTAAGTQRWICKECGSSSVRRRPDRTRAAHLDAFVAWLMGNTTQHDVGPSARSFRRRHAWCWNVDPHVPITGEVYDEVQVDGTYLTGGWCLLLAIDAMTGTVIGWQWCDTEKSAAWVALLERIPAPRVVVTDGGSGLATALKTCWPDTPVQRCLVHVQRNVRRELTMRPRTDAGRALRAISLALTRIRTREQATAWEVRLHEWHQVYSDLINAKTYLRQAGARPSWARANATWWWTHDRLRK